MPNAGLEHPLMQLEPIDAERVVDALSGSGPKTVDRDGEVVDSKLRHSPPSVSQVSFDATNQETARPRESSA